MKSRLLTKQFCIRFASYFFWYLVVYTTITYLFRGKGEQFWSLTNLSEKFAFALFMALIFAVWNPENSKFKSTTPRPDLYKPTTQKFLGTYLMTLLFTLPMMTLLMVISWGLIELFAGTTEPFWPVLLKSFIITAVMCLLVNVYLFISQLFSYRRKQKGHL